MDLIQEAYFLLFGMECEFQSSLIYSGRLKDFGANCCLAGNSLNFKMSRKWFGVSKEIQIGIIQELMLKLWRKKRKTQEVKTTTYIELYNSFIKNIHVSIPKEKTHPKLEESFNRVNERYFLGLVEIPNLTWGRLAKTTYGSYDYKTDTVTISKIFQDVGEQYLDYIMFHEVLHKQRKFEKKGSKTMYHDTRFKRLENVFENKEKIEKELRTVVGKQIRARKGLFRFW